MKKCFAVFCAFVLLPAFTTQAWIGGPFSNNSYFGENGDDGVYEATGTGPNAIGLFRIVVGNNFEGSDVSTAPTNVPVFDDMGNLIATINFPGFNSGNVVIGAFGNNSNTWFFEGVFYSGSTLGTVNSALGIVQATAVADDGGSQTISSAFRARLIRQGDLLPVTGFRGAGSASVRGGGGGPDDFEFTVFGTKVSSEILFGF